MNKNEPPPGERMRCGWCQRLVVADRAAKTLWHEDPVCQTFLLCIERSGGRQIPDPRDNIS